MEITPASEIEIIRTQALATINVGLRDSTRLNRLDIFSSEPMIELIENLPMSDERTLGSPLVQDYINFFSYLVEELGEFLGPRRRTRRLLRPFILVEDQGQMVNPTDETYNVALRVETLLRAFSSIAHSVETTRGHQAAQEALRESGHNAAAQFSKYLADHWNVKKSGRHAPSTKEKLDEWCTFDSSVGFGKFEPKLWGDGREGIIELKNNFLISDRSKEDINLCSFMTGYIQRVLEAVFGIRVVVEHKLDEDCGQYKNSRDCSFRFTQGLTN